ncbi:hypothetical protein AGMMS4956_19990 [Bacteroidia bacterium]|nr:hypothetical protein AGMMS4956_19990 [Bacteroidia bacterium]
MKKIFLSLAVFVVSLAVYAAPTVNKYFREITMAVDTSLYCLSRNTIERQQRQQLYFEYTNRYTAAELRLYPHETTQLQSVAWVASGSYRIIDSLMFIEDEGCWRGKIRFADLQETNPLSVLLNVALAGDTAAVQRLWTLPLLPYNQTWVRVFAFNDVLFVGEEKSVELETNNADNIRPSNEWQTSNGVDYRVSLREGRLMLVLRPRELGTKKITAQLETIAPFVPGGDSVLRNTLEVALPQFTVKASRLAFLDIDKKEITYDDESRQKGVNVVIENHIRLQKGRTYRIEAQEAAGGSLIGELFTQEELANDKMLCKLTVFNLHRIAEGYLYIKDGDNPRFITNVDITPQMRIIAVRVLHEGGNWQSSTNVHPGETVDVSIEGEALHKSHFTWQDARDITTDSINRTENRQIFRLRIPMSINKKQVVLCNNGQPTGTALSVVEYQQPHPFDFITLNYGNKASIPVNKVSNTILARNALTEFSFSFDKSIIDGKTKLYGKQYIDIDITVVGRKGEIIEMKSLKNQVVCPDETSPRGTYYQDKNCLNEDINLYRLLNTKLDKLDPFSVVKVDIKQLADKYSDPVFEKHVEVMYQKKVLFDIDLSLPAGMMIQNLGKGQDEKAGGTKPSFTDNLGGISIALIAQFSFSNNEKAGRLAPFRCGAGFLFLNTFNFNENAKRDLAIVAVGSIYPLGSRRMWNVPIHFGTGYKIQDRVPFLMISPGISISW